jgi:hypothetical protein
VQILSLKVDFKKSLQYLYNPPKGDFHIVDVPVMNFLMIDGMGNPNVSSDYKQAVECLYSLSYGIKFTLKSQGLDYVIPPLEGLWWMEDMNKFTLANKGSWEWTMMIMQPVWVKNDLVEKVREAVYQKKKLPMLKVVHFEPYYEGLSVQILYTGAYEDEAPTIAQMHNFINNNGYHTNGKHHEIYLGDPRKTSSEKLQTILRQPIIKE